MAFEVTNIVLLTDTTKVRILFNSGFADTTVGAMRQRAAAHLAPASIGI